MGQQPNVELEPHDLPRSVLQPAPPARWRPTRPGEIVSPEQTPWGGPFGRPGPDAGYAYRLIEQLHPLTGDTAEVVAAIMSARASYLGRAPVAEDLEVALMLLGLAEGSSERIVARGREWIEAAAHEQFKGRKALSAIDPVLLAAKPEQIRFTQSR